MSCLANLLASMKTALDAIDGTGSYHHTVSAVEYRKHEADGEEYDVNSLRTRPKILLDLVNGGSGDPAMETVDQDKRTVVVDVVFLFQDGANSLDYAYAADDIRRALNPYSMSIGGGKIAQYVSDEFRALDEDELSSLDGLHHLWTFNFETEIGDPDTGA